MKVTKEQIKEIVRKILKEGTGGMSSASMGGPVLAEEESADYFKGYSVSMEEIASAIEDMAEKSKDQSVAVTLKNLSRELKGKATKAKAKSFKFSGLKEMFSRHLEPKFKKLDQVSNETGKHKLLYEWVKTGNISFKEYLELSKYINKDSANI